jgi:hypothetical protein
MKIKIILQKKKAFLCCLLVLFIFNSKLYSQVVYTDIIPDATPSATYPLDLNNDAIVDFLIQFSMANKVMCIPQNNNAYLGDFVGGVHLPWALSASNAICASQATWYDSSNPGTMAWGTTTASPSIGYWLGATNKYLALKLIVGANTYYGWVRLDFLFISGSFSVKDYAYQSTPNACIQSGQTALSINEHTSKTISSIFPNPFSSSATIQTSGNLKNASLTICNAYGQIVKRVENITGQSISVSRDNLASGLYFMRLIEDDKIIAVEKLVITD